MGIVSVIAATLHLFSADCTVFSLFAGLPMRDLAKITLRYMKALFVIDDNICLEYTILFSHFLVLFCLRHVQQET